MVETAGTTRHYCVSRDEKLATLQRILQSKTFSTSKSLRQILELIVSNDSASSPEDIKEYSIATEVLGRPKDFDPKADNIVRVQVHRLRERLEEYYQKEGRDEQVRISIPRGHYSPEYVKVESVQPPAGTAPTPEFATPSGPKSWRPDGRWLVMVILLAANLVLLMALLWRPNVARNPLPLSLRSLWQPFISSNGLPLLVFANPAFLVDEQGNLYRYQSPRILSMPMGTRISNLTHEEGVTANQKIAGPFYYFDSYAGSGDLVAASKVSQFLASHGKNFLIERSRIASYEDIKGSNVIFLGGNKEDRLLENMPLAGEFAFEPPPTNQYPMGSYIRDIHPVSGHPSTYGLQVDPTTGAIQMEYALISFLPNVTVGHYVLDLGGLTTLGTQAAANFATSERDMALLKEMLSTAKGTKPGSRFFQALLQVRIRDGVPLEAKCLLVRELKQRSP